MKGTKCIHRVQIWFLKRTCSGFFFVPLWPRQGQAFAGPLGVVTPRQGSPCSIHGKMALGILQEALLPTTSPPPAPKFVRKDHPSTPKSMLDGLYSAKTLQPNQDNHRGGGGEHFVDGVLHRRAVCRFGGTSAVPCHQGRHAQIRTLCVAWRALHHMSREQGN